MTMEAQKIENQLNEPQSEELTEEELKDSRFKAGEMLPYKGVWFEIEKVLRHQIILKPRGDIARARKLSKAARKAIKKKRRVKVARI